jgi:hypothetical protein
MKGNPYISARIFTQLFYDFHKIMDTVGAKNKFKEVLGVELA